QRRQAGSYYCKDDPFNSLACAIVLRINEISNKKLISMGIRIVLSLSDSNCKQKIPKILKI
ncbi:hypothetical protein HZS_1062, partial [Henneguya salminicola]